MVSPTTLIIHNVSLSGREPGSAWDVQVRGDRVEQITPSRAYVDAGTDSIAGHGALLTSSLCHPHIHLDKAYLLSHPKYADLQVEQGDFPEAMKLTEVAKSRFERVDLLERGQRVIDESVAAGVTHMRAFVEVDAGVHRKCLDAGLSLKAAMENKCVVQLCAFAQLPLFSPSDGDENGMIIQDLMRQAAREESVDVVGSTPYVESDREHMEKNVEWMIDLSLEHKLHLDFHLDYNLNADIEPLVWFVVQSLKRKEWSLHNEGKTIVFGHCTRLTLFDDRTWCRLAAEIAETGLPISFVGLPTSDLFMMRTGKQPDIRGTLDVPRLIKDHGLNACIGVNNIGNAFTPQGSCDPVSLASQGIGIYQAGTKRDAELLFECVSTRAKSAIGYGEPRDEDINSSQIKVGSEADFVVFGNETPGWQTRTSMSEAVYLYDCCRNRTTVYQGTVVSRPTV